MSLDPLTSLLAAVVVLLIGTLVNRRVRLLSTYNIPDPITGGLLYAAIASIVWATLAFRVGIDQTIKPVLLLMFFAGVGMCADLRLLKRGGKALVLFLLVLPPTSWCRTASASRSRSCSTSIRSSGWWRDRSRSSAATARARRTPSASPR